MNYELLVLIIISVIILVIVLFENMSVPKLPKSVMNSDQMYYPISYFPSSGNSERFGNILIDDSNYNEERYNKNNENNMGVIKTNDYDILLDDNNSNIDKSNISMLNNNILIGNDQNNDIDQKEISVVNDTRYKYVSDQIDKLREKQLELKKELSEMSNIVKKINEQTAKGDYIVNGWFIQFHNVMDTPSGVFLGEIINKVYGVPVICFRTKEGYPFVGPPDKPMFFPKSDTVGMRAMTVLKIPKTGYYDFKILTDDGMRLYYQKVSSSIILNEKNSRTIWTNLIDSWFDQADVWITSEKLYFNQDELICIRIDYYELTGFASACVRLRYYLEGTDTGKIEEVNIPYKNSFCSLLWAEVPLLGAF